MNPTSARSEDGTHWIWYITEEEKARVKDMIGFDLDSINLKYTHLDADRVTCPGCGKLSGFDDFVENALRSGVHKPTFMVKALLGEIDQNNKTEHKLSCSKCQTSFGDTWVSVMGGAGGI